MLVKGSLGNAGSNPSYIFTHGYKKLPCKVPVATRPFGVSWTWERIWCINHINYHKTFNLAFGKVRVFITRGQLWPSGIVVACVCLCVCVYVCVCVRQSSVCPDDNLSPAQATITKCGPEVQNTLIKIPIVFGVHWPWPSRSNWT